MTYCLALKLRQGLIFASDSRTTAGSDYISIYRKMHVFQPREDRLIVVLTSGSLATTQEVLDNLRRDLASSEVSDSLASVQYLFEAARCIGKVLNTVVQQHAAALQSSGFDARATLIVGGQIGSQPPELYMVYPAGNYKMERPPYQCISRVAQIRLGARRLSP
jgi:putative proteasome-type protease